MKRFALFLLSCLFVITLTGCSHKVNEIDNTSYTFESEPELSEINTEKTSLDYIMKEENIEFPLSDGTLFYRNIIKYPFFEGDTEVEKLINQHYAEIIANFKNNDTDYDEYYEKSKEWMSGNPPYYDDVSAEVTYNKNGVISIKETSVMYSGGLHAYHEITGITYETASGKELDYSDILEGSEEEIDEALVKAMEDALGYEVNDYMLSSLKKYAGRVLCDEGLCFYYNVGDAVPRVEVLIPFTDENSYIISLGNQPSSESTSEYTEESKTEEPVLSETAPDTFTEKELTQSELDYFETMLNPSSDNYNNCFLTSHYSNPSEINPEQLIYSYQGISQTITEEDKAILISDLGYTEEILEWIHTSKYLRTDIDSILRKKANISLDQLTTQISYPYSEKTDAYYLTRSDTNLASVDVIYGKQTADDTYVIGYTGSPGMQLYSGVSEVTLKIVNGEFIFYSNVKTG